MYTIMVVDEQKRMLNIYKKMIRWEDYNFEIISFSDSQTQALSYYREYKHDLVILDLKLKTGSGLSLIHGLKAINSDCQIIVCSYENNYELIRAAWLSGVQDFIKKDSLKGTLLIENIERLVNFRSKHALSNQNDQFYELEKLLGLIRDEQLVNLDKFNTLLENEHIIKKHDKYHILYFRIDNAKKFFIENPEINRNILGVNLRQIFNTVNNEYNYQIVFSKKHSGIIIIKDISETLIYNIALSFIDHVQEELNIHMSIIVSKLCEGYEYFYDAYLKCINSLERKFYLGDCSLIFLSDQVEFSFLDYKSITFKEDILKCFMLEEYDDLTNINLKYYQYMCEHLIVPSDVVYYCSLIINSIERYIRKKSGTISKQVLVDILCDFSKLETIMDVMGEFNKVLNNLVLLIQTSSQQKHQKLIFNANTYIENHMSEKIKVDDFAKTIGMTSTHISRIFKQETGESLLPYINKQKMLYARHLMKDSQLKIKEIAEAVGFEDQLYFNKVFKKYYNCTPRDFRKQFVIQVIKED